MMTLILGKKQLVIGVVPSHLRWWLMVLHIRFILPLTADVTRNTHGALGVFQGCQSTFVGQ
jgi:hypothetical protein